MSPTMTKRGSVQSSPSSPSSDLTNVAVPERADTNAATSKEDLIDEDLPESEEDEIEETVHSDDDEQMTDYEDDSQIDTSSGVEGYVDLNPIGAYHSRLFAESVRPLHFPMEHSVLVFVVQKL
mmetsp:Transcript_14789/g.22579  ORF Transcript_14789/g.22579 Transcript_14789/m.22579 type:complete len:123 (-) Transcript_14789:5655-6023(-)